MSDPIIQSTPSTQNTGAILPSAANPATAAALASSNPKNVGTSGGTVDSSTTVGDMNALKERAPEIYDKMILGMAQNICAQIKKGEEKRKAAAKRYNDI